MITRINALLRDKNISASQFADEIKIQRSGMSHILSGRNKPSLEFVLRVLHRYPEINPSWLVLGKGEMYLHSNNGFQTELFSPIEEPEPNSFDSISTGDNIVNSFDLKHINNSVINEDKPASSQVAKVIEKIVVFYDDKTFDEYKKN